MPRFRFAVNVLPKPGILDPQGRAVEQSLPHLDLRGISEVRVGRRIEATVEAVDEAAARAVVERLAGELLANPLIERYGIELLEATSSIRSDEVGGAVGPGAPATPVSGAATPASGAATPASGATTPASGATTPGSAAEAGR